MKFTIRLVGALWLSAMLVVAAFALVQIREERGRLVTDLQHRAELLAEGLKEALEPQVARPSPPGVERILKKVARPQYGMAVYDRVGNLMASTSDLERTLPPAVPEVTAALKSGQERLAFRDFKGAAKYLYAMPLTREDRTVGALLVVLDAAHLAAAEWDLWQYNAVRFMVLAVVLTLIALAVVRASITTPMAKLSAWTKDLRTGRPGPPPDVPDANLFGPLALEVSRLAGSFHRAKAAAEEEAALRLAGETVWTEERLKQFVTLRLAGRSLVVVSNREPVTHVRRGGLIVAQTPASGLVTAMEPMMRACGGVWVAHGSGDADRETVDDRSRIGLPEDDPRYTLRRVWLTQEEEEGYYYGFANEGLWPLCHIVHTRPIFRPSDFARYLEVNGKFAATVIEEIEKETAPLILLQDYHFALLPALIKAERPDARVAIFWHIPWPNFEAFGICPWQRELLLGMLGADLIGFHTQYHCNNFLETLERTIEARIDWEHFSVLRGDHETLVKPFPISVAPEFVDDPPRTSREELLQELGVSAEFLGVGVERIDYTKGLPERFRALRWFFERHPEYRERVVFVQLAAPSRSPIPRYQQLQREVEDTIREVNQELQTRSWRPIIYLNRHHDHRELWAYYRHADFCAVTSLHDGMNLVAKEFVSVRDDDGGVLILSRFTGAARELRDALLVNPYDIEETAEAIRTAVAMPADERAIRMARMRRTVREHNIYQWAGLLLSELTRIPLEAAGTKDT